MYGGSADAPDSNRDATRMSQIMGDKKERPATTTTLHRGGYTRTTSVRSVGQEEGDIFLREA
jgi:uncharacterized protein YgiB involved in biofilm formation